MSTLPNAPANSLLPYLAGFMLAPFVRKSMFSGKWVPLGQCVVAAQLAYETGAVLGYRFRDRMPGFAKLFCEPGRQTELVTYLKESARAEMSSCQGERATFFDLRWKAEVALAMEAMRRAGRTKLTDTGDFHLIAGERIRPANASPRLQTVMAEGIGLGCGLPELTERLWRNSFEFPSAGVNPRQWAVWRAHGLDVPEIPPAPENLKEAQVRAVSYIVPYITRRCPEMVQELGL